MQMSVCSNCFYGRVSVSWGVRVHISGRVYIRTYVHVKCVRIYVRRCSGTCVCINSAHSCVGTGMCGGLQHIPMCALC